MMDVIELPVRVVMWALALSVIGGAAFLLYCLFLWAVTFTKNARREQDNRDTLSFRPRGRNTPDTDDVGEMF